MASKSNRSSVVSNSTLFDCCIHGDLQTLRIYLKNSSAADLSLIQDDHGATLAHYAARNGHENILRYFVEEKHLDLSQLQTAYRVTCLHDAAVCDQVDIIKYLLHSRHEKHQPFRWNTPDNQGNTALHLAASYGCLNVLRYLLENESADPHLPAENGFLPIHYAAQSGHDESIKCLLSFAPDTINALTKSLLTPIALASQSGSLDSVQLLLSRGAKTTLRDENGLSCLHWASFNSHLHVVQWLIEKGHHAIDELDHMNRTPLHYASSTDNESLVNYLLDRHARILASSDGNTPLHVAAENGQFNICLILITRAGCSVGQANQLGLTPIDLANQHGYPVLANELRLRRSSSERVKPTPNSASSSSSSSSTSSSSIQLSNATVVRLVVKKRNIERADASNQVDENDLVENVSHPLPSVENGSTSSRHLVNQRFDLSELRARVEEHEALREDSIRSDHGVSDVLMHSMESLNQQNKPRSRAKLPTQTYAPWLKMTNTSPKDFQQEIQRVGANLRKVHRNSETSENIEYLSRRSRQSQSVEASMVPKSNSSEFSPMSKRDDVLYDRIEDSTSRTAQNPRSSKLSVSKSHQFITPISASNGDMPEWRRALVERRRGIVNGGTSS